MGVDWAGMGDEDGPARPDRLSLGREDEELEDDPMPGLRIGFNARDGRD